MCCQPLTSVSSKSHYLLRCPCLQWDGSLREPPELLCPSLPIQTSWEDLNKMDPIDLTGCEDDDMFTSCKEGSSKLKEAHGSSKWCGFPLAKKARMDTSGSHKGSKSKSHRSSHTLQDKQGECKTSTKEPKYQNMRYLTFAPVMDLEELFQKCSFDQSPVLPVPSQSLR